MEKILTVSIAAYNVEKYIEKTLSKFVVPNVRKEIEVLIINDGSTDGTVKISKKFVEKYPDTFVLLNKDNGGWGSTVNMGIDHAHGKYFKQLDGDDYFDSETLEGFINILNDHNEDLIYTNYLMFDDETDKIIDNINIKDSLINKRININDLYIDFPLAMHACTFKTNMLKKESLDITEKCFYTDAEYLIKSLVRVKNVFFAPINVYCYRVGREGQSVSVQGFRKHYKEHIKVVMNLLDLYNKLEDSNVKKIVFYRLNLMIDYQYHMFLYLENSKAHAKELKEFDNYIKDNYNQFYKTNKKRIKIFRIFGITVYPFILYR